MVRTWSQDLVAVVPPGGWSTWLNTVGLLLQGVGLWHAAAALRGSRDTWVAGHHFGPARVLRRVLRRRPPPMTISSSGSVAMAASGSAPLTTAGPPRPDPTDTVAFLLHLETEVSRLRDESEAENGRMKQAVTTLRQAVAAVENRAAQSVEALRQEVVTASVGVNGKALDEAAWALVAIAAGAACQLAAIWM